MTAPKNRPVIRAAYHFDRVANSRAHQLCCPEETRTVQSERDNCDINVIVKRFGVTGQVPQSVRLPTFESYEDVFDYQTAMQAVIDARDAFMELPAKVRERFNHDPQRFLEYATDPANLDGMRELGLAPPKATPAASPPGDAKPAQSGSGGNPQ